MKKWFEIINKADKAEIWIYEQIGEDFWSGGGVTAKQFQKELSGIKSNQIDLHINSPGGEVFDGLTIYNLIKQHPANVTTYIDGLAASIASVIALAGDQVVMAENSLYMIHNPWGMAMGDSTEMRKMADRLDKVGGSIATAYTSKSGKDDAEIIALMDAETWMTAQEALDFGFIDKVTAEMDMAACAKFVPAMQKAKFKNIPDMLNEPKKTPDPRECERTLRKLGCSATQAKAMIAEGFQNGQRDVDDSGAPEDDGQRDVDGQKTAKRDRIADLLIRAEIVAPAL